jgi:hypothetical protein
VAAAAKLSAISWRSMAKAKIEAMAWRQPPLIAPIYEILTPRRGGGIAKEMAKRPLKAGVALVSGEYRHVAIAKTNGASAKMAAAWYRK